MTEPHFFHFPVPSCDFMWRSGGPRIPRGAGEPRSLGGPAPTVGYPLRFRNAGTGRRGRGPPLPAMLLGTPSPSCVRCL
ncbi:hypothetical protein NQZ68_009339 [Dissostichus eleginoides]|nr:hypothetical protein NQZ68_009339 [Dissostichus eleginoides]